MTIANDQIRRVLSSVFPHRSVSDLEVLQGGLINTNVKVSFESQEPVVLRLYRDGADVCKKEVALHNLVSQMVKVPRILHADPDPPSFAVLEFVEGITFQQLTRTGDLKAIHQASTSVGETLASIGRFQFSTCGRLLVDNGELIVGDKYVAGPNPITKLLDQFLTSPVCAGRLGRELSERTYLFTRECSGMLPDLEERPTLVHSDFGNRNILVHEKGGRWQVAAVLDWEFAFSGSPLLDVGHFLRYERMNNLLREPHFSRAYVENGGVLPDNWREIARVIDLTALVQILTIENLPTDVELELIELITATVDRREISDML
jgi:aminoglycoside phosphotransferase (APT) family kinase protein